MTRSELADTYRRYIAALNRRDWAALEQFVHADVVHNNRRLGIAGYRDMLETDVRDIPDLRFRIDLLACDPPFIACRLGFDCAPRATFLGLAVNGRRISFTENVFYRFGSGRIVEVWSIIDKPAIEAQL